MNEVRLYDNLCKMYGEDEEFIDSMIQTRMEQKELYSSLDYTIFMYDEMRNIEDEFAIRKCKKATRRKATFRHNAKKMCRDKSVCDLVDANRKMTRLDYDNSNRKRCAELMHIDRNGKPVSTIANGVTDYQYEELREKFFVLVNEYLEKEV